MDTVIARSRARMWTAFRTPSGIPVLNIQEDPGSVVTIALSEEQARGLCDPFAACSGIEDAIRSGRRITPALPTPPLGPYERLAA